jgi:hypothetical protein
MTDTQSTTDEQVARRNLITSIFVALLIAIAYQETVSPVRSSIRESGITLGTMSLFIVFFLTSLRFFIGGVLHLMNKNLYRRGTVWFYDFMIIVLECTILIFLGGNSAAEENRIARLDFVQLLILLYVVDILWIISQWFMGRVANSWHREFIPWGWCILNTALLAGITLLNVWAHGTYSNWGYALLLAMNIAAFVVDVVLMDYFTIV